MTRPAKRVMKNGLGDLSCHITKFDVQSLARPTERRVLGQPKCPRPPSGCLWPARSRLGSQGLPSGRRPQPGSQPTSGGGRPPGVRSPCGCSSYAARGSAQTLARATASRDRIIKAGVQPPPHPKGQQCQLCFSRPHSRSTASRPRYKPSHRAVSRGMRVPSALIHTLPGEHSPEGQRHLDAWHRKLRSPGAVVACRGLCSPFTTRPVWRRPSSGCAGAALVVDPAGVVPLVHGAVVGKNPSARMASSREGRTGTSASLRCGSPTSPDDRWSAGVGRLYWAG